MAEPAVPPEQNKTMSPSRSATPSDRTSVGTAGGVQRRVFWPEAILRRQMAQNKRRRRLPLRIWGPIETHFIRSALDVKNARLRLVNTLNGILHDDAPGGIGRRH